MIGRFATAEQAKSAWDAIERMQTQISEDMAAGRLDVDKSHRFTKGITDVLREINLHSLSAGEAEDFGCNVHIRQENEQLLLHTDDIDIGGFIKLMVDRGAKVEVWCADYAPPSDANEDGDDESE